MQTVFSPSRHAASDHPRSPYHRMLRLFGLVWLLATLPIGPAAAAEVRLAWDAVPDPRVAVYQVQVGHVSGTYDRVIESLTTEQTIDGLLADARYFFAVRACTADRSQCSASSNELAVDINGNVAQPVPPPRAAFTVNRTSGSVPLTVLFTDHSEGEIASRAWSLGDGTTDDAVAVAHTYVTPGTYSVQLRVSGPGGADEAVEPGLVQALPADPAGGGSGAPTVQGPVIEVGEVTVDQAWQWVPLRQEFADPVVIAGPLSSNGGDPAMAALTGMDAAGFWARVQEWDYLDGSHVPETLGYLAMDRGSYQLADGTRIEAGRFTAANADDWGRVIFTGAFDRAPVVIAAVNRTEGDGAVIARLRGIGTEGFDLRLYEQEANAPSARVETVSYIAWEPSAGELNGLGFEVGRTDPTISDQDRWLAFAAPFVRPPVFIADIQTTNGTDPASLRWREMSFDGVILGIEEEQSLDAETEHLDEAVGYFAFDRGELSIRVSADNADEVYVNGELLGRSSNWMQASSYDTVLQRGENVIAVKATDAGGVAGFIAALEWSGGSAVSDGSWKVSTVEQAGWNLPGFNDSGWANALAYGAYGTSPWHTEVAGFPSGTGAQWIWSADNDADNLVYLRYRIVVR